MLGDGAAAQNWAQTYSYPLLGFLGDLSLLGAKAVI